MNTHIFRLKGQYRMSCWKKSNKNQATLIDSAVHRKEQTWEDKINFGDEDRMTLTLTSDVGGDRPARAELDRRLDVLRVALGEELGRRLSADEQYYSVHGRGAYLGLHMDEVSLSAEFPSIRVDMHAINAASSRTHR